MKREGIYVKNLSGTMPYQSFRPSTLPPNPNIAIDDEMNNLIKKAYQVLGKLNGVSSLLPNKDLFISMYVRKEALLSSQIKGTQATLDDIFDPQITDNVKREVEEIINYLDALHQAETMLETQQISIRYFKEIHRVLLSGRRGEEKHPGELRSSQNWIGPMGSTLKSATFVPPNVADMKYALSDLEKFIHQIDTMDVLLKTALVHYQFETIHPFLDGNGRIGRLLINILLKEYQALEYDTLYISYYLKKNRMEYYDRLMDVRKKGYYEEWITFFLKGIIESATHALLCINEILKLREMNLEKLEQVKGKQRGTLRLLFDYIESHPIIDITQTSSHLKKSFNTISSAILQLVDLEILVQIKGQERYRVYAYHDYLELLRDGTEL